MIRRLLTYLLIFILFFIGPTSVMYFFGGCDLRWSKVSSWRSWFTSKTATSDDQLVYARYICPPLRTINDFTPFRVYDFTNDLINDLIVEVERSSASRAGASADQQAEPDKETTE